MTVSRGMDRLASMCELYPGRIPRTAREPRLKPTTTLARGLQRAERLTTQAAVTHLDERRPNPRTEGVPRFRPAGIREQVRLPMAGTRRRQVAAFAVDEVVVDCNGLTVTRSGSSVRPLEAAGVSQTPPTPPVGRRRGKIMKRPAMFAFMNAFPLIRGVSGFLRNPLWVGCLLVVMLAGSATGLARNWRRGKPKSGWLRSKGRTGSPVRKSARYCPSSRCNREWSWPISAPDREFFRGLWRRPWLRRESVRGGH